jgi:hypothetical protein
MVEPVTSTDAYAWLRHYFRQRPDIGFWSAIMNVVLEPANPFTPNARRSPRPAFLFTAGLIAGAAGWFFYFNYTR